MEIRRDTYLEALASMRHTSFIKAVTGMRRCGKSYLLFRLFPEYLRSQGVAEEQIVKLSLDSFAARPMRSAQGLYDYLDAEVKARVGRGMTYVLIDEIQLAEGFEDVLNDFLLRPDVDLYVTGSNARLLSRDIITTFRGRAHEIRLYPLTFREYMTAYDGTPRRGLDDFMTYGGLPQIFEYRTEPQRVEFLKNLFTETYLRDIKERYTLRDDGDMEELIDIVASNIGALTNPRKLADTFRSEKRRSLSPDTIKAYLGYLEDAFLIERATRYDLKGKRYIDTPYKYYFADTGLRNARLNFRQTEPTHLMENVVYNELRARGFNVDVGVVPVRRTNAAGIVQRAQLEVDFVCNMGSRRYYIQSAYSLPDEEKVRQEEASLRSIDDYFKRIIVTGDDIGIRRNEAGITTMSVYDFLLRPDSLEL